MINPRRIMDFCGFKAQTLELFGKKVSVFLKENSGHYDAFRGCIHGVIEGRIWGEHVSEESVSETVIAIQLMTEEGMKEVSCTEILFIRADNEKAHID